MPNPLVDDWLGYHAAGCQTTDPRFGKFIERVELGLAATKGSDDA